MSSEQRRRPAKKSEIVNSEGLWGTLVKCGEAVDITPGCDFKLTNYCIGEFIVTARMRCSLLFTFKPAGFAKQVEAVVGSVAVGRIEGATCDLILEMGNTYTFEVFGSNSIQIYGTFLPDEGEEPAKSKVTRRDKLRKMVIKNENANRSGAPGEPPAGSSNAGPSTNAKRRKEDDQKGKKKKAKLDEEDEDQPESENGGKQPSKSRNRARYPD